MHICKPGSIRSTGVVDESAVNSIITAFNAGVKDIDIYMFPCLSSSPYSIAKNVSCPAPQDQVDQTIRMLLDGGIRWDRSSNPRNVHGPAIGRVWLDIEDEVPSKYYNSNTSVNQAFLSEISSAWQQYRVPIGE